MKLPSLLFFFLLVSAASAQIKIDSGYTVMSAGIADSNMSVAFLLGDLHTLMIKETSTGLTCTPTAAQWTFIINSEIFQTNNVTEAIKYLPRLKPKDLIFIEKIVLPEGCFPPPKQIVITIN